MLLRTLIRDVTTRLQLHSRSIVDLEREIMCMQQALAGGCEGHEVVTRERNKGKTAAV
jgi:hypothetical protein